MTYKMFSVSNICDIEILEGDETAAIDQLKIYNNTIGLLVFGAYDQDAGTWLYYQTAPNGAAQRLLFMGAALTAPPAAPAAIEELDAPKPAPGAAFGRRVAELEADPFTACFEKTGAEVEDIMATFGEYLSKATKTKLAKIAGNRRDDEADQAEQLRRDLADQVDGGDMPAPGAKHTRNAPIIADREAQDSRMQEEIDKIDADPMAYCAEFSSGTIDLLLTEIGDQLAESTFVKLTALAEAKSHVEAQWDAEKARLEEAAKGQIDATAQNSAVHADPANSAVSTQAPQQRSTTSTTPARGLSGK